MASYKVVFVSDCEAAGIYRETGVYNSYPYYKLESKEYYIYRNGNYWALSTSLGGSPLWNKNSTDITGQWTILTGTVAAPTVSEYEEISYVVSNAGSSYVNGEYTYTGVYNGKPYYAYRTTLPGTSYTQIFYMSWKGGTTGWIISTYLPESVTGIPLYHSPTANADSTPDEVTWEAVDGEAPAPTVTVSGGAAAVPSYYTTNTPGNPAAGGVYVWDGALGGWSNGTFYMRNTGKGAFWIYHKNSMPGASYGTYYWLDPTNATGYETPDTVTFYSNTAMNSADSGIDPAPVFAVYSEEEEPDDSDIPGRRVSGAGLSAANGDYSYIGEYNGKPIWEKPTVPAVPGVSGGEPAMYIRWVSDTTGWQITTLGATTGTVTPAYFGLGDMPETVTWNYATGTLPLPTVTVIESSGGGDNGGGDTPDGDDTAIVIPEAAPEAGAKGIMLGDIFIPNCPNPADSHLQKISAVGKNVALDWFTPDVDMSKATVVNGGVTYQAPHAGWLVASGKSSSGLLWLAMGPDESSVSKFQTQGNCMFVPRGWYYRVLPNYSTYSEGYFVPCKGSSK